MVETGKSRTPLKLQPNFRCGLRKAQPTHGMMLVTTNTASETICRTPCHRSQNGRKNKNQTPAAVIVRGKSRTDRQHPDVLSDVTGSTMNGSMSGALHRDSDEAS